MDNDSDSDEPAKSTEKADLAEQAEPTVLVGNKNVMSYVMACKTLFDKGAKEVVIKARGRLISRAVDVAEITRRRFMTGLVVKSIEIGTTSVTTDKGSELNVSTIDITLHAS
ncbi:MAG: DNA-binding protein Alba [Candidatus Thorarchaeota archaeon]|nr:MAG: DNA-binding protein Alba [Candidatus Thorarchaeota archaeon]